MGLVESLRNGILDFYFGGGSLTPPGTVYLALIKTDTNEVSGGSYARVAVATGDWAAGASGAISNSVKLTFPQPTATWGTIDSFKLFDALTGGNEIGSGDLPTARSVTAITPAPEWEIGNLRVVLT
jgi:hypothetical protein